jgi:hypothetical protein
MTIDSLRDMIHATSYQPFTIRLADDRSVPVPHPDFMAITGGGGTVFVASSVDDHFTIVDSPLIPQLEVGETTSSAK